MKAKHSQQQKLFQKMSLTPQLRQSIKLLGMSTKELNEFVDAAVQSNPFLKKTYSAGPPSFNIPHEENPRDILLGQLKMTGLDDELLETAEYLIYEMDENGYISVNPEDAAADLSASAIDVATCIEMIQRLDPPGIGARDLRSCLELQLVRKGQKDSLEYALVSRFLPEIARNDVEKIAAEMKISKDDVAKALSNIKKLNPRPGASLLSKKTQWVMPDLKASVKDKKIRLELNREWLPGLEIYNPYEDDVTITNDPETGKFIKENMAAAKGLADSLKRREDTIWRVANYILGYHKNELVTKNDEIKSLTPMDIAKALGLHLSTVSRTIANKYIQLEGDVIPLKQLLSHSIKKENGEVTSCAAIKKKIEAIINDEDKSRPLTDSAIQKALKERGVSIGRRTIAKYRQALRILPTHLRKKL